MAKTTYKTLDIGDVFACAGGWFMKIVSGEGDTYGIVLRDSDDEAHPLVTGTIYTFKASAKVTHVKFPFTINEGK